MLQSLRRHKTAAIAVLVLPITAFLAATGPGSTVKASLGDLTCAGGIGTITFTPGATFATQTHQIGITGNLGDCTSVSQPAITGGTFVVSGTGSGNCSSGGEASATGTVTWSNSTQSTFTANLALGIVLGIPTMRGESHVTGGPFTGDLGITLPLTAGFDPANCVGSGLTTAMFANAATEGL